MERLAEHEDIAPESEAEQRARIERERASIERGEAQLRAGLGIEMPAVLAWLDELDTNPDAPMPKPTGVKYRF